MVEFSYAIYEINTFQKKEQQIDDGIVYYFLIPISIELFCQNLKITIKVRRLTGQKRKSTVGILRGNA